MKKLISFIVLTLVLISCSTTKNLKYTVTYPATIELPDQFMKIGIINRSLPNEGEEATLNKVDEILSAEGLKLDYKGSEASINTMIDLLNQQSLEKVVKIDSTDIQKTTNLTVPSSIDWNVIESICEKNDLDGLISLEYYDTQSSQTHTVTANPITLPNGTLVKTNRYNITINTNIHMFWRIYDYKTKTIIDERESKYIVSSNGSGISLLSAYNALKNRERDVINKSTSATTSYVQNLFEYQTSISNTFYTRGSENLKKAGRSVEVNSWEKAMKLWVEDSNNPSKKIGGRATYNMAIGLDVDSKPDSALFWAQKSYEDFGDKRAKRLSVSLINRTQTNK